MGMWVLVSLLAVSSPVSYWLGRRLGWLAGYAKGRQAGYAAAIESAKFAKERERINARRSHDERSDSAGNARVTNIQISQRNG